MTVPLTHAGELLLLFVLAGAVHLELDGDAPTLLEPGACLSLPPRTPARLVGASPTLELLEVTLPS